MRRYCILIPVLWLAFGLRIWQLADLPPGLWYDEGYYAMDAVWLLDGGPWRLFFAGNNGREPLFIYLQAWFIYWLGTTPFTPRLVGSLTGMLTIPVMYVWTKRLTRQLAIPYRFYLPYLATLGLTISFWHVTLSRGGFRGVLLPLFTLLVFYSFWRGWQSRSWGWLIMAGLMLGASQYTYLAARSLPLVFALFALIWTRTLIQPANRADLTFLWGGLLVMAGISAVVFAPLGWIFWQTPALFSARTGDVLFTPDSLPELLKHLLTALRLFIDGGDPNWRHHFPGRPMLGWLGWVGFWPGLWLTLRNWRQSAYLFSLTALLILYLPALLSVPPVHALRLSSLLPLYYLMFAIGLLWLSHLIQSRSTRPGASRLIMALFCGLIITLETGLTGYDYFYRWGHHRETYIEYNTPLVELVEELIDRSHHNPVLIPFHLYVHPTTRYLLYDEFPEQPPPAELAGESVQVVQLMNKFQVLNVANIPDLTSWVWLTTDATGHGAAYVSRPPRAGEQAAIERLLTASADRAEPFRDRLGRQLAEIIPLPAETPELTALFDTTPLRTIHLSWGQTEPLIALTGYEVTPQSVTPGQPVIVNLYWHSLTNQTFDYWLFGQLIDDTGQPINQWEGAILNEDMYRWRPAGILPTQLRLWVGAETPPGPYLVRLGFFNPDTNVRLPLQTIQGVAITGDQPLDQIHLGLFYVSSAADDPYQPATDLTAQFGDAIELQGVTLPADPLTTGSDLPVTLHWRAIQPTDKPYTVFLQLLNSENEVVAGWDSQPFSGLYPTHLWSPGEQLTDTFTLPLPPAGLPPGDYRLISGFYNLTTGHRLPVTPGGDFVELARLVKE